MAASSRVSQPEHLDRLIERLTQRIAKRQHISRRYSWVRLGMVAVVAIVAFVAFQADREGLGWSAVGGGLLLFMGVATLHRRVLSSIQRHRIWLRIKQTHLARMQLAWQQIPVPSTPPPSAQHPFGNDLNLTGARSIQHLLDTAISQGGSERLRTWLLESIPNPDATLRRQCLVRELVPRTLFRDRLRLNGVLVSSNPDARWEGEQLRRWLEVHDQPASLRTMLLVLSALAVSNILLITLYITTNIPAFWMITVVLYIMLYGSRFRFFKGLFDEATYLSDTLRLFRKVFEQLEHERYHRAPHLKDLCTPFREGAIKPSQDLRRVIWIAAAASSQKSELLWLLLNSLGPWDLFFAHLLHRQKAALRERLPLWLDVWYELEALSSLANFAHLHPHYTFPVFRKTGTFPLFEAQRLGHPLIPQTDKVLNDFRIDQEGALALVTGSNMSGKSTFLRTIGVNLRLAYAGGPVDATALTTVPVRLFTCLNVLDSVNDGISYFYAEVKRLKALLLAVQDDHSYPLFFLIDEIFRGTNNRERLIGSQSYIYALGSQDGVGLISTHDLELVHLADTNPHITNYHFRETVAGGKMVFDYLLRDGPCPTTNALKIMAMEGLPVEGEGSWLQVTGTE